MSEYIFSVENDEGLRLDKFLSEQISDRSRSFISNLIKDEKVLVNGKTVSKSYVLKDNDIVKAYIPEAVEYTAEAEDIPLDVVYEDSDLIIINKPKGMVVHPAAGNFTGTLVNALMHHCKGQLSGINGVLRPGIVHRIDKNTSGLLVVAKNDMAHNILAEQLKEHSVKREYRAVAYGRFKELEGRVDLPIGRDQNDRKKMTVTYKNSKNAVTNYRVIEELNGFSYISCVLETGRTHQIRVHMAHLGHPLAGDDVYGPKKVVSELQGQCLHAKTLGFVHPASGEYMEFDSELPEYFTAFLEKHRNF
ncbi:MAG: RluA family pseudouridine synthase [Clostridia bacterium]|nr:RluA family pseudouridine synthase [Clostridia bacterium]